MTAKTVYDQKVSLLEKTRQVTMKKQEQAQDMISREKKLIKQEADKIANQEIKKVSMSYKSRIRRMKGEHKEAVNIRDQYILFALIATALSVVIPLIEKHSYAINWVIGVNAAYLTYMVIQLIRFIKSSKAGR